MLYAFKGSLKTSQRGRCRREIAHDKNILNAVILNLLDVAAHFSPRLWFCAHFTKNLFLNTWLGVIIALSRNVSRSTWRSFAAHRLRSAVSRRNTHEETLARNVQAWVLSTKVSNTRAACGPRGHFVRPAILLKNLQIISNVAKRLEKRCREKIESKLNDTQCDFRPGRCSTDHVFIPANFR